MSSVYEAEKIYPPIPASAPPDEESYRLKKIDELEKFLRSEVESRDKLTKRFKRRATAATFSDTSVIAAITILGGTSIVLASTGFGIALIPVFAPNKQTNQTLPYNERRDSHQDQEDNRCYYSRAT